MYDNIIAVKFHSIKTTINSNNFIRQKMKHSFVTIFFASTEVLLYLYPTVIEL